MAAGRLLQSRAWLGGGIKITRAQGETYPQAVARAISTLDDGERGHLRELVAWVLDYERFVVGSTGTPMSKALS